jgi:zinc-binding alcohol dehydrogenase/oxidoreductase
MKALVLHALNEPPRLVEVDDPTPGAGEAVVRLEAAALNHRDVWIMRGQYAGISFPAICGSDGAGVVEACDDPSWLGKRVIFDPGLGWGDDIRRQSFGYQILGMPRAGTLAEKVAIPTANLHEIPSHLDATTAAALPLAGVTAWRALTTRAAIAPNDKVIVCGIGGGVALAALQFAVALGAEVWVTSSQPEKIERAVALGARGGFSYAEKGWGKKACQTLEGGADVIVDGAGGPGFAELIDALALGGRIAVYGATRGKWPELVPPKLFFRQASILTTTMGSPPEFRAMVAFVAKHRINPIVAKTFSLAEGAEAFDYLASGAQQGKVVLLP